MRAKRKTLIRIETQSVTVVRPLHNSISFWCEVCGVTVQMVTPEYAALIAGTNPREIYRCIETRQLHFVEMQEGDVFICCVSLQDNSLVKRDDE